jgi:hypothetical protein
MNKSQLKKKIKELIESIDRKTKLLCTAIENGELTTEQIEAVRYWLSDTYEEDREQCMRTLDVMMDEWRVPVSNENDLINQISKLDTANNQVGRGVTWG